MKRLILIAAATLAMLPLGAGSAQAAAPTWQVLFNHYPTHLEPGATGRYDIWLLNVGDAPSSGTVTLTVQLPPGVQATAMSGSGWTCPTGGALTGSSTLVCTATPNVLDLSVRRTAGTLFTRVGLVVDVPAVPDGTVLDTTATVEGGGAATRVVTDHALVSSTPAAFGLERATAEVRADATGTPATQAAAHPYDASTTVTMNTVTSAANGLPIPAGSQARSIRADLPAGFVGNPRAAPTCPPAVWVSERGSGSACPASSQVGYAFAQFGFGDGSLFRVYNLDPSPGQPALFGAWVETAGEVTIGGSVDSSRHYSLAVTSTVPQIFDTTQVTVTLWGTPADHNTGGAERRPFLTNPMDCGAGLLTTTMSINSWADASVSDSFPIDHDVNGVPFEVENCGAVEPIAPSFSLEPDGNAADSPTGLDVDLSLPYNHNPDQLAAPLLKKAVVTLPEGASVNPSAAAGLEACSDEQIGLLAAGPPPSFTADDPFDGEGAECPPASKLGTVEVTSPLLDESLTGDVVLGTQKSTDPQSGEMLRLFLVLRNEERGLLVKLAGSSVLDPITGRVTATFDQNPQLPFDDLQLHFKSGPRAPIATPVTCGSFSTESDFTAWSAPETPTHVSSPFDITASPLGSCPTEKSQRPFALGFEAGSTNPLAGHHSPFTVHLVRSDGNQEFDRVELTTPAGFAATLRGVPQCSEEAIAAAIANDGRAEQQSSSCPAASQVGTTTIGAGAGNPFYVSGKVYLAGPYKGAPLSLAFVVPAVAGPFDLGVQVVRAALNVDPNSAQITAVSDSIPQILAGIPLRVRDIRIDIDRPDFTLNPTNCTETAVSGRVFGASGAVTPVSNRFQVDGCADLPFSPQVRLSLTGGTKRGKFPALKAVVTQPENEAGISSARVLLPHSEFLEQGHIGTVCTRPEFAAKACPAASVYGRATAWTPLLDEPLTGNVYLRANGGERELPDLVAELRGPATLPIEVDLVGYVDAVHARIRNTFALVPDAPVSKFVLEMQGGKKGLLVNSADLCKLKKGKRRATVNIVGQNNKRADQFPVLTAKCKKGSARRR